MTMAMPPGSTISGTLRNDKGEPIAAAKVQLDFQTADALRQARRTARPARSSIPSGATP